MLDLREDSKKETEELFVRLIEAEGKDLAIALWQACSEVFESLPSPCDWEEVTGPEWDERSEKITNITQEIATRTILFGSGTVIFTTVTSWRELHLQFSGDGELYRVGMLFTSIYSPSGSVTAAEEVIENLGDYAREMNFIAELI